MSKLIELCIPNNETNRRKDLAELDKSRKFIVDDIFQSGEIHLIGGPSGSGKTTWLLQTIKDWTESKDILGYKSNPEKYLYFSCDRSMSELGVTLNRIGLKGWDIHAYTPADMAIKHDKQPDKLVLEDLLEIFPDTTVFFIEAIGWFAPEGASKSGYNDVMKFWSKIKVLCEERGITIIGTTHSPKAKPKEKYGNPRERVIGSVGQTAIFSTIIVFDFGDETKVKNTKRIITICPRNVGNQLLEYELNENGVLVYVGPIEEKEEEEDKGNISVFENILLLDNHKKGESLDMAYFKQLKDRAGIGIATMYRLIKKLIETGYLVKIDKGDYMVEKNLNSAGDIIQ